MKSEFRTDHRTIAVGAAFVAAMLASPVHAAQPASAAEARILSGGVGEGERAHLAQEARGHNLKLVFTLSTGSYLAEVPFRIERRGALVADQVAQGPWAFAKLPPGAYTIKAAHEGRTLTRQVNVPASGQARVAFSWPASARVAEQPQRGTTTE